MLTIGRIRPGGADYYVGEVASSAEDYYLGDGEAPGRWVGSLAAEMGLTGKVDPDHFRSILEGRHPFTGEQLVAGRQSGTIERHVAEGDDRWLTAAEVARQLRCSDRRVRQLIAEEALAGEKAYSPTTNRLVWRVRLVEVNRYAAANHPPKSRPGFDLTLRPPKSVSVLWALGDDTQRAAIRQAHREAVDEVVAYIERQAMYARRKGEKVLTHGMV
ncbi:MAG: relaxase domain-containing protein, partial [Thermoleophilaceae bacterium]|nr:relaxase domain-containing protein [Thermoleophilaceae bacterium]